MLWTKLLLLTAVAVVSADDVFELEESTVTSSAMPPESDFLCVPEIGFLREGGTYNNPDELITSTPMECCGICFEDPLCLTWSRHRMTGACALMNTRPPLTPNGLYDSGLLDGVDALKTVLVKACPIESSIRYPKGIVLRKRRTRSARRCCELCRENIECFSWFYKNETRRCVLNGNVPPSVDDDGYQGNALY